jgi:hypothetical protein
MDNDLPEKHCCCLKSVYGKKTQAHGLTMRRQREIDWVR